MQPDYLNDVSSKYGAPMGRRVSPVADDIKATLLPVPLDSGGYDPGGAYWGIPSNLWGAYNADGDAIWHGRHANREAALAALQSDLPGLSVSDDVPEIDGDMLEAIRDGYLEAVLFGESDDDESPLDQNYNTGDFGDKSSALALARVQEFIGKAAPADVKAYLLERGPDCLGHDIYYSSAGHGVGFFCRDLGEAGDRLQDMGRAITWNHVWAESGKVHIE